MTTNHTTTPINSNPIIRQLKVKRGWYDYQSHQTHQQQSTIAEILLKGKWLADAGFEIDSKVNITIEHGRLVITTS